MAKVLTPQQACCRQTCCRQRLHSLVPSQAAPAAARKPLLPSVSVAYHPQFTLGRRSSRLEAADGNGDLEVLAVGIDALYPGAQQLDTAAVRTTPTEAVLAAWRRAHAVCLDVDCTCTLNDSLDLLAEFMNVGPEVASLTNQAMNGSLSLEAALKKRLDKINCTPHDIQRFIAAHPPTSRLVPNVKELIRALKARGTAVYLISGGFRELTLPIARELGIPPENVFANRMNWQADDDTGLPTKLVGFDLDLPTAHQKGKAEAISQLRHLFPYDGVVMIGDGITDLEAAEISGGADIFIGFGGVVRREAVAAGADWFITDFRQLQQALPKFSVTFVGSGAWACAAAKIVAQNVAATDPADQFEDTVRMWVYEEEVQGRKLSDIINEQHENVKYLPGVQLGANIMAVPDLGEAVQGADILVICAPHQFVHKICSQLRGKIKPQAIAVSLTKGMRVRPEGPQLISEMVRKVVGIDCSVLMGANIAADIARGELSEATIGYTVLAHGQLIQKLFESPFFYTDLVSDVAGTEMCGTLKNVIALAAGMVDGLGMGPNTKAAVLRGGLNEMRRMAESIYPDVRDSTFFESCGMADLIATSFGGRNRLVAEAYTRGVLEGHPKSFDELEAELLAGQKLQGVLTSNEVQQVLRLRGWEQDYPLFTTINRIVNGQLPPAAVVRYREAALLPADDPVQATANPAQSGVEAGV